MSIIANYPILYPFTAYGANGETIGQAVERQMQALRPDDWVVAVDHDTHWCTPTWYDDIAKTIMANPGIDVFTCMTNRAHQLNSPYQMVKGIEVDNHDIRYHRKVGDKQLIENGYKVLDVTDNPRCYNGVVTIMKRKTWDQIKNPSGLLVDLVSRPNIIAIDTKIHKRARGLGMRVGVMLGVYIYHWYRGDGVTHIS